MIKKYLKSLLYLYIDKEKKLNTILSNMPDKQCINFVDIGAAGGLEPRWKAIEKHISYYGFEPDKRSINELNIKINKIKNKYFYPFALWSTNGSIDLNLCKSPGCSSVFKPNNSFLNRFPNSERFNVASEDSLDCVSLDDLNISRCDFMKLDIQGAELEVLKGAKKTLSNTLGLEIEVEFVHLYTNQPLFGDLCAFLSTHNFELMDFTNIQRWGRHSINERLGQAVFGDALFLKSPEYILENHNNIETISAYLKILLIYRRFDLIDILLKHLTIEERALYKEFEVDIRIIKRKFYRANKISNIASKLLRLIGVSYRSHLIY